MGQSSFAAFLARKNVEFSFKRYFVDALGAMGVGLFASLITGLILKTIGSKAGIPILVEFGGLASSMVGPAIAVAIAQALKAPPMVVFSCAAVGFAGNTWGGRWTCRRRCLSVAWGPAPWAGCLPPFFRSSPGGSAGSWPAS